MHMAGEYELQIFNIFHGLHPNKDFHYLFFVIVDGEWSTLGDWGACSVSCGLGSRTRRRKCDDPPAVYGGAPCIGEAEGASPCLMPACPGKFWVRIKSWILGGCHV